MTEDTRRHRQLELMAKSLTGPTWPRSGTARLIVAEVLELFWSARLIVQIDPELAEVGVVIPVEGDPDGGLALAHFDASDIVRKRHGAPPDIAGALCQVAWWLLRNDPPRTAKEAAANPTRVSATYMGGDVHRALMAKVRYFRRIHAAVLKEYSE